MERRRVLNLGRLQGAQELEKSVFLARLEPFKFLGDMPGLAAGHLSPFVTRTASYFGWPVSDPDRLREIVSRFER